MQIKNKTVIVQDLLTSYSTIGVNTQPCILFLHGWGDSKETFLPFMQELEEYYCVAVDLPGFGASQVPQKVWELSNYSTFVKAFIAKLKVRPAIIVGHSNGGAISVYGLAHDDFHADKLILLASAGIRDVDKLKKSALKVFAKSAKVATKVLPKKTQNSIKKRAYQKIGSELHLVPGMEETFKKTVSYDISKDATQVKIPTLLIYGDDDTSTPSHYGEKLHGLMPYAKLQILPGVGHMIQHEDPKQAILYMKEFI